MDFALQPALPEDAPRIAEIYFSAFTNTLSQRLMPRTKEAEAFQTANFKKSAEEAQAGLGKDMIKILATAPDQQPVIAGFALWKFYSGTSDSDDQGEKEKVEWPSSSDRELCESFFSGVERERKTAIGDQPHYCLHMLAVDPAFGRRGLGAKLLKWGLDRADEKRLTTFISASPAGRALYEKHGCRAVHNYEVVPGYRETSMVRPVAGLSRG
ncbi:acyl-CoA N-acyltransferase [Aspergillus falconensis]